MPQLVPSASSASSTVIEVDATTQDCLTDAQVAAFRAAGLLVIRGLIRGPELTQLQQQTLPFVERALAKAKRWQGEGGVDLDHTCYMRHRQTGAIVPFRQEYVVDRVEACRLLLAHPFILKTVAKLQGPNFTPTWDSMVFKAQGGGAIIPWHRDSHNPPQVTKQIFNVDFYLDGSDQSNCVWGIPGSNRWTNDEADADVARRNRDGQFDTTGAMPIPMQPGDVLLHDITALHGSPWAQTTLRRVLYYEFRAAEDIIGSSHSAQYCVRKQRMMKSLINERAASPVGAGETPAAYAPTLPEPLPEIPVDWKPHTYLYEHSDYPVVTGGRGADTLGTLQLPT